MRLCYLDLLRFVAAAAVFAQHFLETLDPEGFRPFLALAPGVFGVVLFFLISGYVIPLSLRPGVTLPGFALRRIFRIFPAYLAVLAVLAALGAAGVTPWSEVVRTGGIGGLAANALLVQDYTGHAALLGVSWTLSLEFAWYAAFAASLLVVGEARAGWLSLAGSAGLAALALLSLAVEVRLPLGRLGMLNAALFGYAACRAHQGRLAPARFRLCLAAFLVALVFSQWVAFGHFEHPRVTLAGGLTGWLAAAATFLLFQHSRSLREARLATAPPIAWLGEVSYPVYLVHAPVITLWWGWFDDRLAALAVPALTLALALLLHRGVERPGMALGKRLAAAPRSRRWEPSR